MHRLGSMGSPGSVSREDQAWNSAGSPGRCPSALPMTSALAPSCCIGGQPCELNLMRHGSRRGHAHNPASAGAVPYSEPSLPGRSFYCPRAAISHRDGIGPAARSSSRRCGTPATRPTTDRSTRAMNRRHRSSESNTSAPSDESPAKAPRGGLPAFPHRPLALVERIQAPYGLRHISAQQGREGLLRDPPARSTSRIEFSRRGLMTEHASQTPRVISSPFPSPPYLATQQEARRVRLSWAKVGRRGVTIV